MITTRVKMNLSFPDINTIEPLEVIANKVVIPDIQGRMRTSRNISGGTYPKLAKSTEKAKEKRCQQTIPLIATGQLVSSPKATKLNDTMIKIVPEGMRKSYFKEKTMENAELGDILQNQGVKTKSGKRFFEFFGISKEAELEAMDYMTKYIRKAIQSGGLRTVR